MEMQKWFDYWERIDIVTANAMFKPSVQVHVSATSESNVRHIFMDM